MASPLLTTLHASSVVFGGVRGFKQQDHQHQTLATYMSLSTSLTAMKMYNSVVNNRPKHLAGRGTLAVASLVAAGLLQGSLICMGHQIGKACSNPPSFFASHT